MEPEEWVNSVLEKFTKFRLKTEKISYFFLAFTLESKKLGGEGQKNPS